MKKILLLLPLLSSSCSHYKSQFACPIPKRGNCSFVPEIEAPIVKNPEDEDQLKSGSTASFSLEPLDDKYCISYGEKSAPNQVKNYFSFSFPSSVNLFKDHFPSIKRVFIDSKQVNWVFHPYPIDILTLKAMVCLEQLSEREKQAFLEDSFSLAGEGLDPDLIGLFMQESMESFGKPIPYLNNNEFLFSSNAFKEAFGFLERSQGMEGLPPIEAKGQLFPDSPIKSTFEKNEKSPAQSKQVSLKWAVGDKYFNKI